jgi:branched-subunit amino acid ABC-type transport system permease component
MFVQDFFQLTIGGLSAGAIYALTAIGFVLLWQTSATINFAQGEFVTLPAFVILFFSGILGFPFPLAVLAAIALSALVLGLAVKRFLIDPLLDRGVLPIVIATLALSLLIRYSLQQFWTPLALPFPGIFPRQPPDPRACGVVGRPGEPRDRVLGHPLSAPVPPANADRRGHAGRGPEPPPGDHGRH